MKKTDIYPTKQVGLHVKYVLHGINYASKFSFS